MPAEPSSHAGALRRVSDAAAAFAVAVACLVLVGWAADAERLKRIVPGLVAMNPLTAVLFILSGVSLLLANRRDVHPAAGWLGRGAGVVVAGVGAVILCRYLFGLDLGLDRLLFTAKLHVDPTGTPNRMAPNTAVAFVLVGTALAILHVETRRGGRPAQYLAFLAMLFAALAVLGYAYSVVGLYGVRTYIPMALHTATCFVTVAVGVLCAHADRGMMGLFTSDTAAGTLARRLLPAAVVMCSLLGWLQLVGARAGAFSPEFGVALFVAGNILVFVALIWGNAALLHRLEVRRRATEEKLAEDRNLLRTLIDALPDRIYVKDAAGRYLLDNVAHLRLMGAARPEDVIGKTAFDLFPGEIARQYDADDRVVVRSGEPLLNREERTSPGPGREARWVLTSKVPVRDAGGAVTRVVGISRDITARKQAEEQLLAKHRQLEAAVASERAAHEALKDTQGQLVQTEKLAGLGQMVAGVAHEINNPLSFVSNNLAVLQRDVKGLRAVVDLYRRADPILKEHAAELMAEIAEAVESLDVEYTLANLDGLTVRSREGLKRIQQIVLDLRNFARLDEGDWHEVDLNAGVESTVNIVRGRAKKTQVTVETDLGKLPPVTCYPGKINQVVMNLVANAIDACPTGGRVVVRTRAEDGTPWVRLEVADTGTGIDPAVRARIFDPFFTTKPQGEGTGLGLSISYGIVQDHRGSIDVASTPGQGSTFTIRLPVRPDVAAAGRVRVS